MTNRYLNKFFKTMKFTVRDSVAVSISAVVDAMENEEEEDGFENGLRKFSEDLLDVIENVFDDDFDNYSKESLKINMMLRGYDDEDVFRYVRMIKDRCVENRIGIIDLKRPVELGNLAIALLEV